MLPSRYAHLDVGEASLKYPLPYDEVKPADYDKWPGPTPDLADLRARSAARVKADPEFKYLEAEIDKMDARMASNTISLNKLTRQGEIAAAKARTDEIKVERTARHQPAATAFQLALSDVDKPKLQRVNNEKKDAKGKDKAPATADPEDDALDDADSPASPDAVDPIKTESLNILSDLVDQQRRVKIAKVRD